MQSELKVLIVGGGGFLGSHIVSYFLEKGAFVTTLARSLGYLPGSLLQEKKLSFIPFKDLKVPEELRGQVFDVVINCVALQPARSYSWNEYERINTTFSDHLWSWARENGSSQYIGFSTTAVYDSSDDILTELSLISPQSAYGLSKYASDKLIEIMASRCSEMQTTIFRPPSIFGKNHDGGILHSFYCLARENKRIEVYNSGLDYRNFLYVFDAVKGVANAVHLKSELDNFELLLLGSKDSISTFAMAEYLVSCMGSSSDVVKVPVVTSSSISVYLDLSKIKQKLSVNPMSVKAGIEKYIEAMNCEV